MNDLNMIGVKFTNGNILLVGAGMLIEKNEDGGEWLISIGGCYAATRATEAEADKVILKVAEKIIEGGVTIIVIDDF